MTTPIAVFVDETGIYAPTFEDVLGYLQAQYQTLYGADIDIDPDTQDGQLIAIFADAINDENSTTIAAFNSFRPSFAVGAGLSSIVKINGIRRKLPTASQCLVTLGGTVDTLIANVTIEDNIALGTQWFIPGPVLIPPAGVIDTMAVCTTLGAISAAPGTLTQIISPIPGWQTVTNAQAAIVGAPVENDAQLRRRQTQSTALPALTILQSIEGNLLALTGVTRARVYENDTLLTDANGIPPRSISCVVEGGDPQQIAQTIAVTKAPGIPTYGNIPVTVYDQHGTPNMINYFALSDITVSVAIFIVAASGYSDSVGQIICQAIAGYLNDNPIGQPINLGDIYSPANLDGDQATAATGMTQAELDPLGQSYKIAAPLGLALARPGMEAAGGPYPAGATLIGVTYGGYYATGEVVWVTLDNATVFQATVTAFDSGSITIAPPVPSARSVVAGGIIYGVADCAIRFNEAAVCDPTANILLTVS